MSEWRLIPPYQPVRTAGAIAAGSVSAAERELNLFVDAMANLFGGDVSTCLTELWLNEVASMEGAPGPEKLNWRSVSLSASVKLANRVISSQLSDRCF